MRNTVLSVHAYLARSTFTYITTLVTLLAGVTSSMSTSSSTLTSMVAHIISARCMFSCMYVNARAPPTRWYTALSPKCLCAMVATWYALHTTSGNSTVGTGRPVRNSSAYSVYWNPLDAARGCTALRRAVRLYPPSSLKLYARRYTKAATALSSAPRYATTVRRFTSGTPTEPTAHTSAHTHTDEVSARKITVRRSIGGGIAILEFVD
mmetsp:Transcript_20337/g.50790  ORF Transcript_20337/g.50790 Transcript_20337/m.50790 type:complete len:208 (-) Transcript_20337:207-830(-)